LKLRCLSAASKARGDSREGYLGCAVRINSVYVIRADKSFVTARSGA
jgi:hypothetical protein